MDWKELFAIVAISILVLVVGGALVGLGLSPLLNEGCNQMTADIGMPHRWSFFGGCQVQENDKWIPLDNWRYFGE